MELSKTHETREHIINKLHHDVVHLKFEIFVEYTLISQRTVHAYIQSRVVDDSFCFFRIVPDTIRMLIFRYYYIRKQNEVERLLFVGCLIFSDTMSMAQVKKKIFDTFGNKVPTRWKQMRLRHIHSKKQIDFIATKPKTVESIINAVYCDDQTLGANWMRIHGYRHRVALKRIQRRQICCQQLESLEVFTDDLILMNCAQFDPNTSTMGEFVEIVFYKLAPIAFIKTNICEQIAFNIHPNKLCIKARKFSLYIDDYNQSNSKNIELFWNEDKFSLMDYKDCDILLFMEAKFKNPVLRDDVPSCGFYFS